MSLHLYASAEFPLAPARNLRPTEYLSRVLCRASLYGVPLQNSIDARSSEFLLNSILLSCVNQQARGSHVQAHSFPARIPLGSDPASHATP
jgi:hypothetical protein